MERTNTTLKLGVCAMKKKIEAKPMQEILNRMRCPELEIIIIDDQYWSQNYKVSTELRRLGQSWMP